MRCDNCKYWKSPEYLIDEYYDEDSEVHGDLHLTHNDEMCAAGYGVCSRPVASYGRKDHSSPVQPMSDSGYMGHLFTKPDFGCTLFEAKPTDEQLAEKSANYLDSLPMEDL